MLDVTNYFLVILAGFGVVWSYRHFTGQKDTHISEFEYAAFSTLCGIPFGLLVILMVYLFPELGNMVSLVPMIATLVLFPIGVLAGFIAAKIQNHRRKQGR